MHPAPGRNDPCHCGSGKKYKKCHLSADEQVARAARAAPPIPPMPLPMLGEPPIPELLIDQALTEFRALPYEGRFVHLLGLLAGPVLDRDLAFELVSDLHVEAAQRGEFGRFAGLLQEFQRLQPETFDADLVWYHGWLLEDAVAARAIERLPELFAPVAARAEVQIDEVLRLCDIMLFYNQGAALLEALAPVWPVVLESEEVLAFGKAELGTMLMMLTLYRHLEGGGLPAVTDDLRRSIEALGGMDDARVTAILQAIAGVAPAPWTAADFVRGAEGVWNRRPEGVAPGLADLESPDVHVHDDDDEDDEDDGEPDEWIRLDDDTDEALLARLNPARSAPRTPEQQASDAAEQVLGERLFLLLFEWAGWMWRERGVPLARVELVRDTLLSALLNQPPLSGLQARLLPDEQTMDQQMAALMSFLSGHVYKAAALFALLPEYSDFLVARGLAQEREAAHARQQILSLRPHVRRVLEATYEDPELLAAVRHAGERR